MPSVAVAYRVMPALDLGVRATWGIASVKAKSYVWGVRNYEEAIAYDGVFTVDATDNFVPSFGAGALYRPSQAVEIGLSYHSKMTIKGRGHGTSVLGSGLGLNGEQDFIEPETEFWQCAPGGTLDRLKACITVPLPQMATVGARYILRDALGGERADVELNVRWENWSAASDYHVIVDGKSGLAGPLNESFIRHGFQDVFSVRLGGSYAHDVGRHRVVGRLGVAHDTAAAPDSWQRLDIDGAARTTLAGGIGYQGRFYRLDVGGGVVLQPDRTVAHCNPSVAEPGCENPGQETPVRDRTQPDPVQPLQGPFNQVQSPFNGGEYSSGYVLLSLGFTAWF
jgi:long-subunit fatty acid transport protein